MTPSELLAAFETLAEAPDGVARLRELVLSLAVRGKLVAQDPGEEPSRPLVLAARQHLAGNSDGIRRGSWNMTSEVGESEYPFDLPSGWAWARVNDTGFYINGLAFKPSHWKDAGRPIIRIQNLSDPSKPFNYAEGEFPDDVVVRRGDILVSWSATLEAFVWDREDGVLNQHIFRVKPAEVLVSRRFLYYLLRQAIRDMADSKHAHGLVMAHINRGPFLNHVVAIPPLAEQHRIVARVDELMGLLDRLEAVRNRRDEVRRAARDAALAALRAAPDAEAVEGPPGPASLGKYTRCSLTPRTWRRCVRPCCNWRCGGDW
jgi:type I restriction enzyme S subunit